MIYTVLRNGSRGDQVRELQGLLGVTVDGVFGPQTESAVKVFQKNNGLVADGVVGDKTWGKLGMLDSGFVIKKSRRAITEIIIHCSDTVEGRHCTVDQIRQWHLARNFNDIGYHYVVYIDGSVHNGRDVDIMGAHCTGHNANSIGICYVGGRGLDGKSYTDTRNEAQRRSMLELLRQLRKLYPNAKIYPHFKFAAKACPCFDAEKEYKNI